MKTMKSTFRLALILYICAFMTGVPFVLTASAKITPKKVDEPTKFYEVQKGDTLSSIAKKYRKDARLWREFEKYNIFTNPQMIYPREQLQIPADWPMPGTPGAEPVAKPPEPAPQPPAPVAKPPEPTIKETPTMLIDCVTKQEMEALKMELTSMLRELHEESESLQDNIASLQGDIAEIRKSAGSNAQAVDQLNKVTEMNRMEVAKLSQRIEAGQKELSQNSATLQKVQERIDMLNTAIQAPAMEQTERRAKISEPEPESEPAGPSKQTRTVAILGAVAGGVAWFIMNAVGRSD